MNKFISQISLYLLLIIIIILCSCGGGGHGTSSAHRKGGKGRGGDSCPAFHGNKPSGKQSARRVGWF